jgi:DKNYY family
VYYYSTVTNRGKSVPPYCIQCAAAVLFLSLGGILIFAYVLHQTSGSPLLRDMQPDGTESDNQQLEQQAHSQSANEICEPLVKPGLLVANEQLLLDTAINPSCLVTSSRLYVYTDRVYILPAAEYRNSPLNAAYVIDADPKTFTPVGSEYWHDATRVYYQQFALPGADIESWKRLSSPDLLRYRFSRDTSRVYFFDQVVEKADPATFAVTSSSTAKDANAVYTYTLGNDDILGWSMKSPFPTHPLVVAKGVAHIERVSADPESIQQLSHGFTKDSQRVYFDSIVVPEADPQTFEVLSYNYSRDAQNVWYYSYFANADMPQLVAGADANTFTVLNNLTPRTDHITAPFAKDKSSFYRRDVRIPEVDVKTVDIHIEKDEFYTYFYKDAYHVFANDVILAGFGRGTSKALRI